MAKIGQRYGTSSEKEREGVWVNLGDDLKVKIARANNPTHSKATERLIKPFRRQVLNNTLPQEKQVEITVKAMATGIVKDWEGLEDDDGKTIDYSVDSCVELLTDYKDFREEIAEISQSMEMFRNEEIEEEVKTHRLP